MKQQIIGNKCSHQRDTIKIASESIVQRAQRSDPGEGRQTQGYKEACKGQVIPSRVYNKPKRMWSAYVFDFVLVPPTAAPWETVLCGAALPLSPRPSNHPPTNSTPPPPSVSSLLPPRGSLVTIHLFYILFSCHVESGCLGAGAASSASFVNIDLSFS